MKQSLNDAVRQRLRRSGLPFRERVDVDGYLSDFVFAAPDGTQHVVETKPGPKSRKELDRAVHLAKSLKSLSTDGAFVVVPELSSERPKEGVVSLKGLDQLLRPATASPAASPAAERSTAKRVDKEDYVGDIVARIRERDFNVLESRRGQTAALKPKLAKRLRAAIQDAG